MCFLGRGKHITRGMYFSVGEHISPQIHVCVSWVGKHISLGICVSWVGEHITRDVFPRLENISVGICVSWVGENISLGVCISR